MARRFALRWLVCAACLVFLKSSAPALTVSGATIAVPQSVAKPACPAHSGYGCKVTALNVTALPPGGGIACLQNAIANPIEGVWDPTGWSLEEGAPLDVELKVTTYFAYNKCPGNEGVQIRIERPTTGTEGLGWIQAISTNRGKRAQPSEGSGYLDVASTDEITSEGGPPQPGYGYVAPPYYPYIYYAPQYSPGMFYDEPGRGCEPDQTIYWTGFLFLGETKVVAGQNVLSVRGGVSYGFEITCVPVPEPGGFVVMLAGSGWAVVGVLRRRRCSAS